MRWRSALLEGCAVLIGILVAFGIDAWWDVRTQRAEARAYVEAVRAELLTNRELLSEQMDTLQGWMIQTRTFLNTVVAPGASPSYDEVVQMVWETGPDRTRPIARAALDDLISSGGFRIIESAQLRRALADYMRSLERDAEEQDHVRLNFNDFIGPYHVQHSSYAEYPWEEATGLRESSISFRLERAAFVGNRVYANLLIGRILRFNNLRNAHAEVLTKIDTVLALIESSNLTGAAAASSNR